MDGKKIMNGTNIGERIKELRMQRGMSQNQLAKVARVSQAGLSAIESGVASPSIKKLSLIADALDIRLACLFEDEYIKDVNQKVADPDMCFFEHTKNRLSNEDWQKLMHTIKVIHHEFFE